MNFITKSGVIGWSCDGPSSMLCANVYGTRELYYKAKEREEKGVASYSIEEALSTL